MPRYLWLTASLDFIQLSRFFFSFLRGDPSSCSSSLFRKPWNGQVACVKYVGIERALYAIELKQVELFLIYYVLIAMADFLLNYFLIFFDLTFIAVIIDLRNG